MLGCCLALGGVGPEWVEQVEKHGTTPGTAVSLKRVEVPAGAGRFDMEAQPQLPCTFVAAPTEKQQAGLALHSKPSDRSAADLASLDSRRSTARHS